MPWPLAVNTTSDGGDPLSRLQQLLINETPGAAGHVPARLLNSSYLQGGNEKLQVGYAMSTLCLSILCLQALPFVAGLLSHMQEHMLDQSAAYSYA